MVKVAVFVSGGGTNLQAILDAQNTVIRNAEVALVIASREDAYALERAKKHGVPITVLSSFREGGGTVVEEV